jgi:hypothetical protein
MPALAEDETVAFEAGDTAWVYAPEGLRLRYRPSMDSGFDVILPLGTEVEVLQSSEVETVLEGCPGFWTRVRVHPFTQFYAEGVTGASGWVFGSFLTSERVPFKGMRLPPFTPLWTILRCGDRAYNNVRQTPLLAWVRENVDSLYRDSLRLATAVSCPGELSRAVESHLATAGADTVLRVTAWYLPGGGEVFVGDCLTSGPAYGVRETSGVLYSPSGWKLSEVYLFPSFEYSGPVAVDVIGTLNTPEGPVMALSFGPENDVCAEALLFLVEGRPYLYFTYIRYDPV